MLMDLTSTSPSTRALPCLPCSRDLLKILAFHRCWPIQRPHFNSALRCLWGSLSSARIPQNTWLKAYQPQLIKLHYSTAYIKSHKWSCTEFRCWDFFSTYILPGRSGLTLHVLWAGVHLRSKKSHKNQTFGTPPEKHMHFLTTTSHHAISLV